ncbi:MAG: hypothetical protein ABEJ03_05565 [Candidatus Nanohaloarchaea archaeon]
MDSNDAGHHFPTGGGSPDVEDSSDWPPEELEDYDAEKALSELLELEDQLGSDIEKGAAFTLLVDEYGLSKGRARELVGKRAHEDLPEGTDLDDPPGEVEWGHVAGMLADDSEDHQKRMDLGASITSGTGASELMDVVKSAVDDMPDEEVEEVELGGVDHYRVGAVELYSQVIRSSDGEGLPDSVDDFAGISDLNGYGMLGVEGSPGMKGRNTSRFKDIFEGFRESGYESLRPYMESEAEYTNADEEQIGDKCRHVKRVIAEAAIYIREERFEEDSGGNKYLA